jgi:hypothetical protein
VPNIDWTVLTSLASHRRDEDICAQIAAGGAHGEVFAARIDEELMQNDGSNPRSTVCIDDLFRRLRDNIRSNEQCRRAMDSFGTGFDSTDVIRSTFRGTPGPRMTCDSNDCDPSRVGGRREPHYTPFGGGQIPVCFSLYDGHNSLLHELLHWFGVSDGSAVQRVILRRCYPGSEP